MPLPSPPCASVPSGAARSRHRAALLPRAGAAPVHAHPGRARRVVAVRARAHREPGSHGVRLVGQCATTRTRSFRVGARVRGHGRRPRRSRTSTPCGRRTARGQRHHGGLLGRAAAAAARGGGAPLAGAQRPAPGATALPPSLVVATLYLRAQPVDADFLASPGGAAAARRRGRRSIALLQTEPAPNPFPALPVREGEHVLVAFLARFASRADYEAHRTRLARTPAWTQGVLPVLRAKLRAPPRCWSCSPPPARCCAEAPPWTTQPTSGSSRPRGGHGAAARAGHGLRAGERAGRRPPREGLGAVAGVVAGGACHVLVAATGTAVLLAPSPPPSRCCCGRARSTWAGWGSRSCAAAQAPSCRRPGRVPSPRRWPFAAGRSPTCSTPRPTSSCSPSSRAFLRAEYGPTWLQALQLWSIIALTQGAVYGALALAADAARRGLVQRPRVGAAVGRTLGVLMLGVALLSVLAG